MRYLTNEQIAKRLWLEPFRNHLAVGVDYRSTASKQLYHSSWRGTLKTTTFIIRGEDYLMADYNINSIKKASNLSEIFSIVKNLAVELDGDSSLLWYRGHPNQIYTLLPSLIRTTKKVYFSDSENKKSYSSIHLMEDLRMQQYHANNYQFINDSGYNSIEWMGLAQHHHIKTRLLDWSTSLMHALLFAVEEYINIQKKDHLDASPQLPCLWILKPQELNKRIICKMLLNMENLGKINDMVSNYTEADHKNFIDFFTKAISKKGTDKFEDEVINVYLESPRHEDKKMNYIYNLAYFEKLLSFAHSNPTTAFSATNTNPFHLLLSMAYIDGLGSEILKFTPLAVIQPYQSDRIRAQRGVFTFFPHMAKSDAKFNVKKAHEDESEKKEDKNKSKGYDYNYTSLENNPIAKGILCKIILSDPHSLAEELNTIGAKTSWLYPEAPFVNNEIEN